LGGLNTLASYGIVPDEPAEFDHLEGQPEQLTPINIGGRSLDTVELQSIALDTVPKEHLTFLDNLPLTYETDDHIFVHAGIRPGVAIANQDPEDLLWIRDGFLDDDTDHGRLVVHGHTALDAPQHFGNRVDLDCGAGFGRPLIPAAFDGRDCYLLTETGRVPLTPA
jgi:serine/threonine protein phosphatase 1